MDQQFQLHYLGHSAWLVRTPDRYLLFDYGRMPVRPRQGSLEKGILDLSRLDPLPIYAFASHQHADHYSTDLQRRLSQHPRAAFIMGLDERPPADANVPTGTWLVWPHSQLNLDDITILATASTDSGVSFLVDCPEGVVYHGGDLAVWDDQDFYRKAYRQEIDWLSDQLARINRPLDLAFLPVSTSDGYQEEALLKGLWYFQDQLRPRTTVPMHAHGYENLYQRFADLAHAAGYQSILQPLHPGDAFRIAIRSPLK